MKLFIPCSETIWGLSSSAAFGFCKKNKNPKCLEENWKELLRWMCRFHLEATLSWGLNLLRMDLESGEGEECAFWLKIMPREAWRIPEPAIAVPLGGRVALPGHQPCWPEFLELLGPAQRQEQGRKAPGAQINHPAVFHSPAWLFALYTA